MSFGYLWDYSQIDSQFWLKLRYSFAFSNWKKPNSKEKIINETCLFNAEDLVKHKILDFIGDIALSGVEIVADFECFRSGHKLNHMLLNEIFKTPENYQFI